MLKLVCKVVKNKLPQMNAEMTQRASAAVMKTTFEIEAISKESMQGSKSGRIYPRTKGQEHQASAPGEAPAIDTGNLVNSIRSGFQGPLHGFVSTNVEYAPWLEFGTGKMAARPFFGPAAFQMWDAYQEAMKQVLK